MTDDPKEFCVMLQLRTNDPRLTAEAINEALGSGNASAFAMMRRAVLQHLPKDVTRMIAVFPVEHARMLMMLHEIHGEQIAAQLREGGIAANADGIFVRPPPDYVPPTQE
jgi:hypothetical protein